jgi:uncharacterized protein YndB with AHSA1/START domain
MKTNIRHQFFYAHPVEVVWEYLTKPELISQWLMKNDFQLIPGHEFQFKTKPHTTRCCDGIFYCKVLEIIPQKKLSYSWKTDHSNGILSLDSLVVWNLSKKGNGTQVVLEHSGFKEQNLTLHAAMTEGWLMHLQNITERLLTALYVTIDA